MSIFDLTWSAIIRWWAEIAVRTGFAVRRPRESFEDLTLRVTRKLFIINLVCAIILIAFALVDNLFGHVMLIVFMALTLLSLTLFWVTVAAIPAILGQTVGTFGGLLPTKDTAIKAYRSLAVWETAVALYVGIASYVEADLSLLWLTVAALVVVIFAGRSVSGSTKLMASFAKLVVLVTVLASFWNIGRDAFFNQSWLPLVSSNESTVKRDRREDVVQRILKGESENETPQKRPVFKDAFENAILSSTLEGNALDSLFVTCGTSTECVNSMESYADSVLAVKRGNTAAAKEATPVANASASAGVATENPIIVRIRETESIPLLAEWFAIDYADGRYDSELGERLRALGADSSDYSRMEALRRECGFGRMSSGQIQRTTVYPGLWSTAFNLQGSVDWKICWEGSPKHDRKRDRDNSKIDLWGRPGSKTKHWSRWIQYRGLPDVEPYKVYALVIRRR